MYYSSLRACANDLEKNGKLIRIKTEVDPNLEMAEIHRRIYQKQGPAILFEKVAGSPFQAISNLYGTNERTDWIFRKTIPLVQKVIDLKIDPFQFFKNPLKYIGTPLTALTALPLKSWHSPVKYGTTTIDQLPQIKSWPMDGGAFITLPQVYTEDPDKKGIMNSNIGMYRIQLGGNEYLQNKEIGLHYQIHRGIGVHHTKYKNLDTPFRCSIFVGGPPAHAFSAIMPLPEGLSEVTFAGMLAGRRFRYAIENGFTLSSDADFCITGTISKSKMKPEGPFGDHLGYYSLEHPFPVMEVEKVYHRKDPLWHFTVVGRPPAEDSGFGYLIHQLVKSLTPQEFPGVKEIHAVDAAGVHPLLLSIGSERYMPFRESRPEEILTIANHILGSGQTSLTKVLIIAATADAPNLSCKDIPSFFQYVLERVDWTRDLHFQTKTTIDTLDYSGSGWNQGSKLVIACCGKIVRKLGVLLPTDLILPNGFSDPALALPGILVIKAPKIESISKSIEDRNTLKQYFENQHLEDYPLIVLSDDSTFAAANLNNFLWTTFTRINPSHDVDGVGDFIENKHWGCNGSLIMDARVKPHHAPPLIEDPKITAKVDLWFKKGGELEKWG